MKKTMLKKSLGLFLGVLSAIGLLTGCGGNAAVEAPIEQAQEIVVQDTESVEEADTDTEQEVGMENPWRDITEEEAAEAIPNLFKVPDDGKLLAWTMLDDATEANGKAGPLVDLQFTMDDRIFDARAQITGDEYLDLSGLYYEWTVEEEATLAGWGEGHMPAKMYRNINDSGMLDLITWYDTEIGISYSLSTAAADLAGFDIQAVAEQMYDPSKQTGMKIPDEEEEHTPRDISGCDTFTQIVDTLQSGAGYANTVIDGTDVLLVSDQVYEYEGEGTGKYGAIDAEVYYYDDGTPTYAGYVSSSGTAYPLAVNDGKLFVCGGHYVKKMILLAGGMVNDEEAWVEYDKDGNETYYYRSDTHTVNDDEEAEYPDDSILNDLFEQFFNAEVIEFSKV